MPSRRLLLESAALGQVGGYGKARVADVGVGCLPQRTAGRADDRDVVEQVDVCGLQLVVVQGNEAPVVPGQGLDTVETGQVPHEVALYLPQAGQAGGAGTDAVQVPAAGPALLPRLSTDKERVAGHVQRV